MSLNAFQSKLRPLIQRSVKTQVTRSMTVLSKQSGEEYKKLNYNDRMKKTGRPVSPHVTIFAFPVTALSSITKRLTGMMLSVGAAGLGSIELLGGSGSALALMEVVGSQGFLISGGAKFAVSFPIIYHYLGALRHMAWHYTPDMLNNVDVEKSSYALFGGVAVISAGLTFV